MSSAYEQERQEQDGTSLKDLNDKKASQHNLLDIFNDQISSIPNAVEIKHQVLVSENEQMLQEMAPTQSQRERSAEVELEVDDSPVHFDAATLQGSSLTLLEELHLEDEQDDAEKDQHPKASYSQVRNIEEVVINPCSIQVENQTLVKEDKLEGTPRQANLSGNENHEQDKKHVSHVSFSNQETVTIIYETEQESYPIVPLTSKELSQFVPTVRFLAEKLISDSKTWKELSDRAVSVFNPVISAEEVQQSHFSSLREAVSRWVSPTGYLEKFFLVAILLNSISMACLDYRHIDADYQPRSDTSRINWTIEKLEIFFTLTFLLETTLKSLAYGLICNGPNSYLRRDTWNILDFLVTLSSAVAMLPGTPNVTALRTLRLLRPLRSISKLDGVRKILQALAASMNDLANVGILLTFLIMTFAIMGVVFWRGLFHFRCRTTPFPVRMPPQKFCTKIQDSCFKDYLAMVQHDPMPHKCLPGVENDQLHMTQASSPWFTLGPQDCLWPLVEDDIRLCSADGSGRNTCPKLSDGTESVCGSNYDSHGNPRFISSNIPYGYNRMQSGVFIKELNWGYTTFDTFWTAFLTTFQLITFEGWSDILYFAMDTTIPMLSISTFTIIVTIGGFILVNLVLAVISGALDNIEDGGDEVAAARRQSDQRHKSSINGDDLISNLKTTVAGNQMIRGVVCSRWFEALSMGCIIFNTIILSLDHYGISDKMTGILETINLVLTAFFALEMVMCMAAYTPKAYIQDSSCQLDFTIVIISLIETSFRLFGSGQSTGFSVFRSLRVFRIFKLAKQWKSLNGLLDTMNETAKEIGSFLFLLLLFIFIFALIGMQFFSNRLRFDLNTGVALSITEVEHLQSVHSVIFPSYYLPRTNFDSFGLSVLAVFQILTGENWNAIMYDAWRATSWQATIYFLLVVILGLYVVMNLFLATLIHKFEGNERLMRAGSARRKRVHRRVAGLTAVVEFTKRFHRIKVRNAKLEEQERLESLSQKKESDSVENQINHASIVTPEFENFSHDTDCATSINSIQPESFWDMFRNEVSKVVDSTYFEQTVLIFIALNCISLGLDNPLNNPSSFLTKSIKVLDFIFLTLFALEATMKIIVNGFVRGENAYLCDGWNCVDFVTVVASIFDLAKIGPGKALRALRAIRVLRPIRMIRRVPELKLVVDALILAIPSVANVAAICVLFFLMFSIFGVTYLKGKLYHCKGPQFDSLPRDMVNYLTYPTTLSAASSGVRQVLLSVNGTPYCQTESWLATNFVPTSKQVCDCLSPGEWVRVRAQNFDNVAEAMQLFFELSTTEGWVDLMNVVVDQTGVDMQPVPEQKAYWTIFFVLFILLGAFFVVELFTGAIIQNFNAIREQSREQGSNGGLLMTAAQKQWATTRNFVSKIKPEMRIHRPADSERLAQWCYDFVMPNINPRFEDFTTFLIVTSSLCTGLVAFGDSDRKTNILNYFNATFIALFCVEIVLKVLAMKMKFFQSGWNLFDCAVAFGSALGNILNSALSEGEYGALASLIRLMRVIRLFRLVKGIKSLRVMFNTIAATLPSIANIGALLLLLFFIYAVCGVQLFSTLGYNDEGLHSDQANFRNLGNAMLLLLRFSTGENWPGFMRSLIVDARDCIKEPIIHEGEVWCLSSGDLPDCVKVNGCGSSNSGTILFYFDTFTLIVSFVVLNLFVGVVLNAYEKSKEGDILCAEDLDSFVVAWGDFDPEATWKIASSDLRKFLKILPPPLGFSNLGHVEPTLVVPNGNDLAKNSITSTEEGCKEEQFMEQKMRQCGLLDLVTDQDGRLDIVGVATCLAKRVAQEKQGEDFKDVEDEIKVKPTLSTNSTRSLNSDGASPKPMNPRRFSFRKQSNRSPYRQRSPRRDKSLF